MREKLPERALVKVTNDAPFYVDYLRRELDENYSHTVLTKEGLRIFSSLDLQLQRKAERALVEGLKKLEAAHPALRRKTDDDSFEGAIIVIRPQTGEIKAMVGGRNYQKSQFNRVFQAKRQPGSIFKPFVFLAALMYGGQSGTRYTPDTVVNDSQFTWSYDGKTWQPNNYNNDYFGAVTFRRALESSLNSATARVAQDVGIRRVREIAHRMGIQSSLPPVPSLTLGSAEVTPLEVAVAFSTLANGGVRTRPLAVKLVMDQNAQPLEKRDVRVQQVINPQLAHMMNYLLKGVFDRGTATAARRMGFTRPAAGKTGTTNDYKDAWFVGYTPDLLAVVWVGFDGQSKLNLSGAEAALPIWTEFMKSATASMPVTDFVVPEPMVESEESVASRCAPSTARRGAGGRLSAGRAFPSISRGAMSVAGRRDRRILSRRRRRLCWRRRSPPARRSGLIARRCRQAALQSRSRARCRRHRHRPRRRETVSKPLPPDPKIREQDLKSKAPPVLPPSAKEPERRPAPDSAVVPPPPLADDSSLLAKITPGVSPQRAASLRLTDEGSKLLDAGEPAKALDSS